MRPPKPATLLWLARVRRSTVSSCVPATSAALESIRQRSVWKWRFARERHAIIKFLSKINRKKFNSRLRPFLRLSQHQLRTVGYLPNPLNPPNPSSPTTSPLPNQLSGAPSPSSRTAGNAPHPSSPLSPPLSANKVLCAPRGALLASTVHRSLRLSLTQLMSCTMRQDRVIISHRLRRDPHASTACRSRKDRT